jgi:hypothetical protein
VPDLTNHVLGAYIIGKALRVKDLDASYYLGAVLPDVVSRTGSILLPATAMHVDAMHAPVCIVATALAVGLCFERSIRGRIQRNLLLGAATHMALDLIQRQTVGGYPLLFPFSGARSTGGWIWSDQVPLLLVITAPLALFLYMRGSVGKGKKIV